MARTDLVAGLIKAERRNDREGFTYLVKCLIAEEKRKNHYRVAELFEAALTSVPRHMTVFNVPQLDGLVAEAVPRRGLGDLTLDRSVRSEIEDLIEENQQAAQLAVYGISPRHRVLLVGPPGNGKTSLAEAIASEMQLPMFIARYDSIVSSRMGGTSAKLNKVFEFVAERPCVFFLDEFDAIGRERTTESSAAGGEQSRVVSSLLLWFERVPTHTIVVVATNHSRVVDFAMWRRLQVVLLLNPPTLRSASDYLAGLTKKLGGGFGVEPKVIMERLPTISYSTLENFALDVRRRRVIEGDTADVAAIGEQVLSKWEHRATVVESSSADPRNV